MICKDKIKIILMDAEDLYYKTVNPNFYKVYSQDERVVEEFKSKLPMYLDVIAQQHNAINYGIIDAYLSANNSAKLSKSTTRLRLNTIHCIKIT